MFLGHFAIGDTVRVPIFTRGSSGNPEDSSTNPVTVVEDVEGNVISTVSSGREASGVITTATNASPIVVTSAGHGLQSGEVVLISGVATNTAANDEWTITKVDSNTFSLNGSTGNGAGTGGTWVRVGSYVSEISITEGAGYGVGVYYAKSSATISSTLVTDIDTFQVY